MFQAPPPLTGWAQDLGPKSWDRRFGWKMILWGFQMGVIGWIFRDAIFWSYQHKKKHRTKIKKVFQLQSQESSRGINIWVTCRELGSISQGLSMLGCNQLKNACFFPRASNISTDFSTKTGWNSWYITSYPKFCWKVWGMIYHLRSLQWNAIHYVYIYIWFHPPQVVVPPPTCYVVVGGGGSCVFLMSVQMRAKKKASINPNTIISARFLPFIWDFCCSFWRWCNANKCKTYSFPTLAQDTWKR